MWLGSLADGGAGRERRLVESHATTAFRRQIWNQVVVERPVDERTQIGAYLGSTLGVRLRRCVDDAGVRHRHVHRSDDTLHRTRTEGTRYSAHLRHATLTIGIVSLPASRSLPKFK